MSIPPPQNSAQPPPPNASEMDLGELIDLRAAVNWLKLFVSAGWSRRWLVMASGLAFSGITAGWLLIAPRSYEAATTLVVVRNSYVAPRGEDRSISATQSAAKLLPAPDSLSKLLDRADLVRKNREHRSIKEKLMARWRGLTAPPPSEEDVRYYTQRHLAEQLSLEADNASITIGVRWDHPQTAYDIVVAAKELFLEICHERDVASLMDSISILEAQATEYSSRVDSATRQLGSFIKRKEASHDQLVDELIDKSKSAVPVRRPLPGPSSETLERAEAVAARLAELDTQVNLKQRDLNSLQAAQQAQVASLHSKLNELRVRYTDAHPAVLDLRQQLSLASQATPQVRQLEQELTALQGERAGLMSEAPASVAVGQLPSSRPAAPGLVKRENLPKLQLDHETDSEYSHLLGAVRLSEAQYNSLQRQIETQRLNLEVAKRAFEQRYKVVSEAEVPRSATKGRTKPVIGAFAGGLFFGLFIAALGTLRKGVIEREWQLEQALRLPVLAAIQLKSAEPPVGE